METYDLAVVGGGPGGYTGAVRAAQLGLRAVCVEREELLGGVCLRAGCIPSKALLESSERFAEAAAGASEHGFRTGGAELDLPAMMARKEAVVARLADAVRKLLERHGVDVRRATARLAGPDALELEQPDGSRARLRARHVLLAAGGAASVLPGFEPDGERIVTSTEALSLQEVPRELCVLGAGYVGLELGLVWARLGARVTVVEALPRIAASLDGQIARSLARSLERQGLAFRLGRKALGVSAHGSGLRLALDDGKELDCDRLLVAVGRRPAVEGLGLEEAGVALDATGRIRVDAGYRTSVPSILAVGDLIAGPMLAHKAAAEATAAVERLAGLPGEVNYDALPSSIYTTPEVGSVGLTEEAAKAQGLAARVGVFPFAGNARALCAGRGEGLVKVLVHPRTDRLLGVHALGPGTSELVAEAALALEFGASAEDVARTVHGHPTFGEALQEACRAASR